MLEEFSLSLGFAEGRVKTDMCLVDGPEIFKSRGKQEFQGGNSIENEPFCKYFYEQVVWKIFIEEVKVIPEVVISLSP